MKKTTDKKPKRKATKKPVKKVTKKKKAKKVKKKVVKKPVEVAKEVEKVVVGHKVKVRFIDNTYLSVGSNWDFRTFTFKKERDALYFIEDILRKGFSFLSNVNGKKGANRLLRSDITISEVTE